MRLEPVITNIWSTKILDQLIRQSRQTEALIVDAITTHPEVALFGNEAEAVAALRESGANDLHFVESHGARIVIGNTLTNEIELNCPYTRLWQFRTDESDDGPAAADIAWALDRIEHEHLDGCYETTKHLDSPISVFSRMGYASKVEITDPSRVAFLMGGAS